jgi:transposase-like protein
MPKGPKKKQRYYAPEFRQQLIALAEAGRTPEALSREFEPSARSGTGSSRPRGMPARAPMA